MHDISKVNYYISRKKKMLDEFEVKFEYAKKTLEKIYTEEKIEFLRKSCLSEFNNLVEEIPHFEDKSSNSELILQGAITISIILPLEREGLSNKIIEKIIFNNSIPLGEE